MPEHRKWAALEESHGARVWADAMALWVCVLCHANRNETDGEIPRVTLTRLSPLDAKAAIRAADAMVSVGLMERAESGYRIHDFLSYNPSRADKERARAKEAERGRQRRSGGRGGPSGSDDDGSSGPASTPDTDPRPPWTPDGQSPESTLSRPDPSRPVPERDLDAGGSLDGVAPAPGPTPLGIVEAAYATALGAKGAKYIPDPGTNRPFWVAALDGVRALSNPSEVLRDAAARLATEYVQERRSRSPQWFAEWLAKRAASGTRQTQGGYSAPSTNHRGTTVAEIEGYDG